MKRDKYPARKILLRSEIQRDLAINVLKNAPLDEKKPLVFRLSENSLTRSQQQNALMWAGPLKDIATQAFLDGRTYGAEIWHYFFKKKFLPEAYDPERTQEGYVKYIFGVDGEPILVGSTTQLKKLGFSEYLEQIYAFGADLGVQFHEVSWL